MLLIHSLRSRVGDKRMTYPLRSNGWLGRVNCDPSASIGGGDEHSTVKRRLAVEFRPSHRLQYSWRKYGANKLFPIARCRCMNDDSIDRLVATLICLRWRLAAEFRSYIARETAGESVGPIPFIFSSRYTMTIVRRLQYMGAEKSHFLATHYGQ